MTYSANERSIVEVIVVTILVCFVTGFVAVLCIGNYYRAKKAMERHRQRRLARLSHGTGNVGIVYGDKTVDGSPGSNYSATTSNESTDERQHLLARPAEVPRRRNTNINDDLLLFSNENELNGQQPTIVRV